MSLLICYDQLNCRETQLPCNALKEDFTVNKAFRLNLRLSTYLLPIDVHVHLSTVTKLMESQRREMEKIDLPI